jgi:hypothetical protein
VWEVIESVNGDREIVSKEDSDQKSEKRCQRSYILGRILCGDRW